MPKKRIRVQQLPCRLVIKNSQVHIQRPGYWVDGKWMDGTKAQMKEHDKLVEHIIYGDWYEKFWERRGMTPPSLLPENDILRHE